MVTRAGSSSISACPKAKEEEKQEEGGEGEGVCVLLLLSDDAGARRAGEQLKPWMARVAAFVRWEKKSDGSDFPR